MGSPQDSTFALAQALIPALKPFFLSKQVFQPWPDRPPGVPAGWDLSLGLVLLTLDQLRAWEMVLPAPTSARARELHQALGAELQAWSAAASALAEIELGRRLSVWKAALDDLLAGGDEASMYPAQVRSRLLLDRLVAYLGQAAPEAILLEMAVLDRRLRAAFSPGDFILQPPLQEIYRPATFWYLYGRPQALERSR